jgi:FAD/FMN-containing dehydrogenase
MANQQVIEPSDVQDFEASLRGPLLQPGEAGYDDARKIWNGMIDKRPALIACCSGAVDVINSVNFARSHDLLLAVRGGGHNITGNAVCDGGLMINLSAMKSVRVDPVRRTARAEPGVTWAEFDRETQAFGLATTGGQISTTGIAGLTLGGGWGYLARQHGLTSDNLLSADVVTADGQLLNANATEYADLFWGLRGGGRNFGVVTSFEYQLHPVGTVLAGLLAYPFDKAKEILKLFRGLTIEAPDQLASGGGSDDPAGRNSYHRYSRLLQRAGRARRACRETP